MYFSRNKPCSLNHKRLVLSHWIEHVPDQIVNHYAEDFLETRALASTTDP